MYKEMIIVLLILIGIVSLSLTTYKKNIRKKATAREIKVVAWILSIVLTTSITYGFEFKGLPFALPAYIVAVFFLQWSISQTVWDWIWKLGKTWIEKKLKIEGK